MTANRTRPGWLIPGIALLGSLLALFIGYRMLLWPVSRIAEPPQRPALIAHAGGAVSGEDLTNTMEALDQAYGIGFRYFELDFSWTRSGELVSIHDWRDTYTRLFEQVSAPPATALEFSALRMKGGLTPLTLPRIADWMRRHRDAFVVTDVKTRNLEGLRQIRDALGSLSSRVIPQIYEPEEYRPTVALGFEQVIYTLYKSHKNPYQIMRFAASSPLFAVTIPKSRIGRFNLGRRLERLGLAVYAHTVNEPEEAAAMRRLGAAGVYTDTLTPSDPS